MKKLLLLICTMMFLFACNSLKGDKSKKALLIIPSRSVQDVELNTTKMTLEEAGIIVDVASLEGEEVRGMLGVTFYPDLKIEDVKVKQYDIVTCIGGTGVAHIYNEESILSLIEEFKKQDKYLSAICLAPGLLANAKVIEGHNLTSYPDRFVQNLIKNNGGTYKKESVVVSGKIITGNGPNAAQEFADTIVDTLTSEEI